MLLCHRLNHRFSRIAAVLSHETHEEDGANQVYSLARGRLAVAEARICSPASCSATISASRLASRRATRAAPAGSRAPCGVFIHLGIPARILFSRAVAAHLFRFSNGPGAGGPCRCCGLQGFRRAGPRCHPMYAIA